MTDQEMFDFGKIKGTVNGVLERVERERNKLTTKNEQLTNENAVLKATIDTKESEIKKLNEELSTAKKTIELLDPTGTGQRIVDHAHLFQTKEVDKLTERIVSLEAKTADQLKLIETLQRIKSEQRAELDKRSRVAETSTSQAKDKTKRKRKADTSLEENAKEFCAEKRNVLGFGDILNLNGLTDAKLVCAGRNLSFIIDSNGKLQVAHRTAASKFSVADARVKFKSVVSDEWGPTRFYAIDENNDIWANGFLYTEFKQHEFKLVKTGLRGTNLSTCSFNSACISPEGTLVFWTVSASLNFPPDYQYSEEVIKEAARSFAKSVRKDRPSPGPRTIQTAEKLSQVAMGEHHILVLGISGTVYSAQKKNLGFAADRDGQLSAADFKKVKFPNFIFERCDEESGSEKISQIVCSRQQSAALTKGGRVYVWGKCFNSQKTFKTPQCMDFLFHCSMIQSISISDEHLLVLTEKNEVYSCGMNVCGKKDPHNKEINETPTVIEELRGYKVTQISAGSSYSLVIYET